MLFDLRLDGTEQVNILRAKRKVARSCTERSKHSCGEPEALRKAYEKTKGRADLDEGLRNSCGRSLFRLNEARNRCGRWEGIGHDRAKG